MLSKYWYPVVTKCVGIVYCTAVYCMILTSATSIHSRKNVTLFSVVITMKTTSNLARSCISCCYQIYYKALLALGPAAEKKEEFFLGYNAMFLPDIVRWRLINLQKKKFGLMNNIIYSFDM